jgi:hypothetical protein
MRTMRLAAGEVEHYLRLLDPSEKTARLSTNGDQAISPPPSI